MMNRRALATVSCALVLQLCTAMSATASRSFVVTPENIASQDLRIRVETQPYDNDAIGFRVLVSAGASTLSPRREGRLEIAPEGATGADSLQSHPVLWCSVREVSQNGILQYDFGLPRQLLPRATFAFRNYHPTMPSMDAYVIQLEGFARPGPVIPSGLQTAYDVEPNLVSMKEPVYPDSAREKGIQGIVLVRVLVGVDGQVQDSIVIQSVPMLDESAVAAAKTAVFHPALKDDRPVAVWMVIPVEYRLHP